MVVNHIMTGLIGNEFITIYTYMDREFLIGMMYYGLLLAGVFFI